MNDRITVLSEILPYVREFLGKTFVLKVGGEVCQPEFISEIAKQVSLIHHMGIKVILVHGGGPQMDNYLKTTGIEKRSVNGRRITDDATLEAAKMLYPGLISTNLVAALKSHGAQSIGLSGVDADLIQAVKRPVQEVTSPDGSTHKVDYGHVGDITKIDTALIELFLSRQTIPVIASLGVDPVGNVLNINADTIAAKMAIAVGAAKLILFTNVPGLLKDKSNSGSLISYADIETLQLMVETGQISDGMLPKAESCIAALKGGVPRTHIIDGTRAASLLLELFLNEGSGTMIVASK